MRRQCQLITLTKRPAEWAHTALQKEVQPPPTQTTAEPGVPRVSYRRWPPEGVQAPRVQSATSGDTARASSGVGRDKTRGVGCRPHALEQRLAGRPAGSIQTTPAEEGTGPTRASNNTLRT